MRRIMVRFQYSRLNARRHTSLKPSFVNPAERHMTCTNCEALKKATWPKTPVSLPEFPSGGDPRIELFNAMTRAIEERKAMLFQAEQDEKLQATLKKTARRRKSRKVEESNEFTIWQ
jgi:hypothetical protein